PAMESEPEGTRHELAGPAEPARGWCRDPSAPGLRPARRAGPPRHAARVGLARRPAPRDRGWNGRAPDGRALYIQPRGAGLLPPPPPGSRVRRHDRGPQQGPPVHSALGAASARAARAPPVRRYRLRRGLRPVRRRDLAARAPARPPLPPRSEA